MSPQARGAAPLTGSAGLSAPQHRILVVEDSPTTALMVEASLAGAGHEVRTAHTGEAALALFAEWTPDLVVLDVDLPDTTGFELANSLRAGGGVLILMLTGRSGDENTVQGYLSGADAYMNKPVSPRVIGLTVAAMLRRSEPVDRLEPDSAVDGTSIGGLRIDVGRRVVTVDGAAIELTRIEFDLLAALMRRPGVVQTRSALLAEVWGRDWGGDDHLVSVHMANLRRKVDPPAGPTRITTVRGVGYRMAE